ncbi:MAG TPA: hypothetical protein DDZ99_00465, partial [Clostridiales bacterium]|nr:hypothetical protein [Clostridiales bacterium]
DNTTYTYNESGIRTSKNRNGTVYSYTLDGSKILKETRGASTTLYYYYDESGSVIGFKYNGVNYYYGKNIQGDVKYIYNTSGTVVVEYCYDAWGNIISTTGSLASTIGVINPFRYRSYYYDSETVFYYLNSRYYDPYTGRFINADATLNTSLGMTGMNMFAYCGNNPVNRIDSSGRYWKWIEAIIEFFNPDTNSVSGSFQDGIFKGSGSLTAGYREIMFRGQGDKAEIPIVKDPTVTLGVYSKLSIINASGKVGIGNDDASLSIKCVGDVLTASANAGINYKNSLGAILKAKAAVFSGRATLEGEFLGWQYEFGVTGDALAVGAEAQIGVFDGVYTAKANASLGFGGGFIIRVKPPEPIPDPNAYIDCEHRPEY